MQERATPPPPAAAASLSGFRLTPPHPILVPLREVIQLSVGLGEGGGRGGGGSSLYIVMGDEEL